MCEVTQPDECNPGIVSSNDDTVVDVECTSETAVEDWVEGNNLQQAAASTTTVPDILLVSAAGDGAAGEQAQSAISGSRRPRKVASTTTCYGAVITPASTVTDSVAHKPAESSFSSETVVTLRRRNPFRNKRRHFSDQWSVPSLSKIYCICHKSWKGEAMIQCDSCDVWYHCSCLDIDPIVCDKFAGKNVQFLCGQNGCNSGNMFLKLPDNTCVDVPTTRTV